MAACTDLCAGSPCGTGSNTVCNAATGECYCDDVTMQFNATTTTCPATAGDVFAWTTTGWSSCSARCGEAAAGVRTRSVTCKAFAQSRPAPLDASDESCGADTKPADTGACNRFACQQEAGHVSMDLGTVLYSSITQSSRHRSQFETSFRTGIARVLGIYTYRIAVNAVRRGNMIMSTSRHRKLTDSTHAYSAVVDFDVLPPADLSTAPGPQELSVTEAVEMLEEQAAVPTSALRESSWTAGISGTDAITAQVELVTAPSPAPASEDRGMSYTSGPVMWGAVALVALAILFMVRRHKARQRAVTFSGVSKAPANPTTDHLPELHEVYAEGTANRLPHGAAEQSDVI